MMQQGMNVPALSFDARQVPPSVGLDPVPPDWYKVVIRTSNWKPTNAGDGTMLELVMEIIEGQYTGRKLWWNLNLVNASQASVEIAYKQLSAIAHVVYQFQVTSQQVQDQVVPMLHNIPFMVQVVIGQGKNGPVNNIRGCRDVNGQDPGKAGPASGAPNMGGGFVQQPAGAPQGGGFTGFPQAGGQAAEPQYGQQQPQYGGQPQGFPTQGQPQAGPMGGPGGPTTFNGQGGSAPAGYTPQPQGPGPGGVQFSTSPQPQTYGQPQGQAPQFNTGAPQGGFPQPQGGQPAGQPQAFAGGPQPGQGGGFPQPGGFAPPAGGPAPGPAPWNQARG